MKKFKNKLAKLSVAMMIICNTYIIPVYAKGTTATAGDSSAITNPINNLANLMTSVIAAVGAIILAKNIFDFAAAYQNQDSAGTSMALKGVVAGLIMVMIKVVLTIMGV